MTGTELHIILLPDGKVTITGPINQKLLCYGLLESARDAIKEFNDAAARGGLVLAQPGDVFSAERELQGG